MIMCYRRDLFSFYELANHVIIKELYYCNNAQDLDENVRRKGRSKRKLTLIELWKHEDNTVCIHPGWDLFTGWLAIRESWVTIFGNTEMIKFIITNPKVRVFNNNIAVVVCLENIETSVNRQNVKLGVIATNIFENDDTNQWLLIHHHGSSISSYIPPTLSL